MKSILFSFILLFASQAFAIKAENTNTGTHGSTALASEGMLQLYRQWIPSSHSLERLGSFLAGADEGTVQDLLNTYVLVNTQWLLYKAVQGYIHKDRDAQLAGFLTWHHYIYLGFVSGHHILLWLAGKHLQALVFGLNVGSAYLWSRHWALAPRT